MSAEQKAEKWKYKLWGNGTYDFYRDNLHRATVYDEWLAKQMIALYRAKEIHLIPPTSAAK